VAQLETTNVTLTARASQVADLALTAACILACSMSEALEHNTIRHKRSVTLITSHSHTAHLLVTSSRALGALASICCIYFFLRILLLFVLITVGTAFAVFGPRLLVFGAFFLLVLDERMQRNDRAHHRGHINRHHHVVALHCKNGDALVQAACQNEESEHPPTLLQTSGKLMAFHDSMPARQRTETVLHKLMKEEQVILFGLTVFLALRDTTIY
jgi:hypothetical protein